MRPDANDPRPAYLQVADDLRTAITDGTFQPGQRLPPGRQLARHYGVAVMTIHHAIDVLRDAHLVTSRQGRGVFVSDSTPSPPGADHDGPKPTLSELRGEMADLAERVTRLERLVSPSERSDAQT